MHSLDRSQMVPHSDLAELAYSTPSEIQYAIDNWDLTGDQDELDMNDMTPEPQDPPLELNAFSFSEDESSDSDPEENNEEAVNVRHSQPRQGNSVNAVNVLHQSSRLLLMKPLSHN